MASAATVVAVGSTNSLNVATAPPPPPHGAAGADTPWHFWPFHLRVSLRRGAKIDIKDNLDEAIKLLQLMRDRSELLKELQPTFEKHNVDWVIMNKQRMVNGAPRKRKVSEKQKRHLEKARNIHVENAKKKRLYEDEDEVQRVEVTAHAVSLSDDDSEDDEELQRQIARLKKDAKLKKMRAKGRGVKKP